jgi:hypothetical protein
MDGSVAALSRAAILGPPDHCREQTSVEDRSCGYLPLSVMSS